MRKLIAGILIGVVLSYTSSVAAEAIETLVGKQVQAETPVQIDEQTLSVNGIIIDGTSYGPIRAIGEAAGYEVGFKEGKILLQKQKTQRKLTLEQIEERTQRFKGEISKFEYLINQDKNLLNNPQIDDSNGYIRARIQENEQQIADRKEKLDDLEKQKADLEAKK